MSEISTTILEPTIRRALGSENDPLGDVVPRLRSAHPGRRFILWEGDAQTFEFSQILGDAEEILGHPRAAWLRPGFWAEHIVHPNDQRDAIAYCALATGSGSDHVFEYRALAADGSVVWLEDHVHVVMGPRRVPVRLRGVMFDITEEKGRSDTFDLPPALYRPAHAELMGRAPEAG